MEPQARYTAVGGAVLILVAGLAAVIVWLLASGNGTPTHHYTLRFARQSLEGLEPRSEVRMKGIRIGNVTSFAFSRQQPGTVEVDIDVDTSAPVRQSTRAVVDRNLVTGLATIRLITLTEDSPLLLGSAKGSAQAVIPEGESQLQQFSQTLAQLAQRADDMMQRVSAALSPPNQAALAATLQNLQVVSQDARELVRNASGTLASADRTARVLAATGEHASADLHQLAERYDAVGAQAGASLREAASAMQQMSSEASKAVAQAQTLLSDADVELRLTGPRVRSAAEAVGQTSRALDDPRTALFGPARSDLGPGEASQ